MASVTRNTIPSTLTRVATKAKMLTAERERDLLQRYHANADKRAMDELVRSHMPIIFRMASRSAQNSGVDINDLVQTATEGLLIAINRWSFDKSDAAGARFGAAENAEEELAQPDAEAKTAAPARTDEAPAVAATQEYTPKSSRLATYAMWWMRMLLTDNVVESRGMVARAKGIKTRKALFALPRAIKHLNLSLPVGSNDVTRIATYLGLSEHDIEEALAHAAGDVMLDEPVGESGVLRGDLVADDRAEDEEGILNRLSMTGRWNTVCEALMSLPPRERFILVTRYLLNPKWKLDRLSATLKMSRERTRQIGDDGIGVIRRYMVANPPRAKNTSDKAAREVDAYVSALEQAAFDAETLAAFMKANNVAIGPTRVVGRWANAAATPSASNAQTIEARAPRAARIPAAPQTGMASGMALQQTGV